MRKPFKRDRLKNSVFFLVFENLLHMYAEVLWFSAVLTHSHLCLSVCPSVLSVSFLRGMHCFLVVLVWRTLKTPSTFFYYLQIFGYWKCFAFMPILDVALFKEACVKSTKKFNDKANLTLNSLYWYIPFTISTEMKQLRHIPD